MASSNIGTFFKVCDLQKLDNPKLRGATAAMLSASRVCSGFLVSSSRTGCEDQL